MTREYLTTSQAAKELGISRIAVFKKIKSGELKAEKFGRNYAIPKSGIEKQVFSESEKAVAREAVKKTVAEYGEALKALGKE